MAPHKETFMAIKVDLDCPRCYKKVKKLLCSIPQIQDQVYKEKQNIVMIKVVCCSPEKIRDKIRCKGGKTIIDIQIVEPPKPPPPKPPTVPKPDPPKPPTAQPPAPPSKPDPPTKPITPSKPDPPTKPITPSKPDPPTKPDPKPDPVQKLCPRRPEPIPYYPQPGYPGNVCCSDCYHGHNTGPCYNGYGYGYGYGVPPPPPPPPPGGWVYYDGCPPGWYGYRPGYCVSRCADYINDENPTACVVM